MKNNYKPKIRTNDHVKCTAGNHKHKTGKVIEVLPQEQSVKVQGINLLTHYIKPTHKNPKGGIERKEGPIHISNVCLLDPKTKQPTRIGRKPNDKGKLQRYAKKTGNLI